ncbi:hypothetical protein [Streptomyces sp. NPDC056479]|uniref:hypothetical protein n=1 Tax=unclassified Streptomyces TaxID=2593676 RepID=UPI00369E0FCB
MLGTAPCLFAVGRAERWEEVRTLLYPLAIVLVGLFGVRPGLVFVLGLLCVGAVIALTLEHRVPARPLDAPAAPLPGWSEPPLAVPGLHGGRTAVRGCERTRPAVEVSAGRSPLRPLT